jgi:hypothetical protein
VFWPVFARFFHPFGLFSACFAQERPFSGGFSPWEKGRHLASIVPWE